MKSNFFIKRLKITFALALIIVLAGLASIFMLPVEQYPQIGQPAVTVSTFYPGADATTVADTVTAPLEEQINGVENMVDISSQSTDQGICNITITFEAGSNPEINTLNVNNRVQTALASLPEDVIEQGVTVMQGADDLLMIVSIYSKSGSLDNLFLSNFMMLNLLNPIERCPGVGQAAVLGGQQYAMRIWLNPNKMTNLKVSAEEVINAVNSQNEQIGAGQIGAPPISAENKFQYTLVTRGRLSTPEQFENIIIRSTSSGAYIRLKDIARVELGGLSYRMYGEMNNKPAALLEIYKFNNANTVVTAELVKEKIKELTKNFPEDIEVNILYDSSRLVKSSVYEVVILLISVIIITVLVAFLFLNNIRAALIPAITVPVAIIGAFIIIFLFGYSINIITLFGLTLASGFLIGDVIIIVENVCRIMRTENLTSELAVFRFMDHIKKSIITSYAVFFIILIFIAFMPGDFGRLFKPFAVSVAVCMVLSVFNFLTLIPALCVALLKKDDLNSRFIILSWFNGLLDWISEKYSRSISIALKKISFAIILFIMLLGLNFFICSEIPTGFIPKEDLGILLVNVQLPSRATINKTGAVMKNVTDIILNTDGVYAVQDVVGFSALNGVASSNFGSAVVILDDWKKRKTKKLGATQIIGELNRKFDNIVNAEITVFPPPYSGLGLSSGFEYILQEKESDNPGMLAEVLKNLLAVANKSPVLTQVSSVYSDNTPKIFLEIDRDKVEKMGISMNSLTNTIEAFLGSLYLNEFNLFGQVYQVLVQVDSQFRDSIQDVYNLYVFNNENKPVQFKTFIKAKTVMQPSIVNHYNMLNSATVLGSAAPGYNSGEAIAEMERISKDVLPDNFTYSWMNTSCMGIQKNNIATLIILFTVALIYLVLVVHYESWILGLCVMFSASIAISGYLLTLWCAGMENNVLTLLSLIISLAVIIRIAIITVDFARCERNEGKSIPEAAVEAAKLRFKDIIITTAAFMCGVLPLIFISGVSAESRKSLGIGVLGGIFFSTLLGIIFIPVLYVVIQKLVERKLSSSNKRLIKD